MTLALDNDQLTAIDRIQEWIDGDLGSFVLTGHAGTGKSTLIAVLLERMNRGRYIPIVGTPTGKSAQVLRSKGTAADTIHRLAYTFREEGADGELLFDYDGLSGALKDEIILIIDEASMVDQEVYADLSRSGYRMLFVGDPGQLPPVRGDFGLLERPDYQLTTVHRHDSELLEFARATREDLDWEFGDGDVQARKIDDLDVDAFGADVLLCLKNDTRHHINRELLREETDLYDCEDDQELLRALSGKAFRTVVVQNNYQAGVFNGERGVYWVDQARGQFLDGRLVLEDGREVEMRASKEAIFSNPGKIPMDSSSLQLDLGYALTVHKSQGSEWPHVAVIDETWPSFDDRVRWRYTAATRAQEKLTWIT